MRTYLRKIPIKQFMVGYLGLVLALSSYFFGSFEYFIKGILIVFFYSIFDLIWTRVRNKVWYLPQSSIISGLILALIGPALPSMTYIILLPAVAVFSKQIIRFKNGRHIFNPAAFSLVLISFFYPVVSWSGVAWVRHESYFLWVLIASGIFILWRQKRWETAFAFLAIYAFFFPDQLLDGTLIFFMTVILIEPITSFSPTHIGRMAYGAIASSGAILASYFGAFVFYLDPLLLGLLFAISIKLAN